MKNNFGRFKIIALISLTLLLSVINWKASAGNAPNSLDNPYDQQEVTGIVTGPQGLPIAGVAVFIKGETKGTVTNVDGEFTIRAAPGDTLVFTYLGFKPVEVVLEQESTLKIKMEEDVASLGEVEINAGYYNTTRRESTGNISRVTAEEIELQPVISPLQALQGRMAGVEVIQNGSHPGKASTVRIRGRSSLREEGNYPLYIIDGVPINSTPIESNSILGGSGIDPLNTLNLSNIESIEILKDADATAIYGSRGANGVILITTKKGGHSNNGLQVQLYSGTATMPKRLDLLNTEQYIQIRRTAFENDGVEPTATNAYDLVSWDQNRYTDWQDFFLGGTASVQNANLVFSGGKENTYFRVGGSYFKQGTIYPADYSYQKGTANLAINHTSDDQKFKIDLSANYGTALNQLVGTLDLAYTAFRLPPNAPSVFNDDGTLNWTGWEQVSQGNPLQGFHNVSNTSSNDLVSNLGISFELFSGFNIRSNFGYTDMGSREIVERPRKSYNPINWSNIQHNSAHLLVNRKSWIIEPQLSYDRNFGKGEINFLIGTTFQESNYTSLGLQGQGYVSESLIGSLSAAEEVIANSSFDTDYRYHAIFGRAGFNWNEKYYINFTGRRDGSSRFGPGKKWANFGAVGGAWIFSEEPFFKGKKTLLSFGKLRASYGTTGNDQIGDYGYLDAYEATTGAGGIYPVQLANPNFSWEVNKKLEAGLDLAFYKDRLNLNVNWYRNRSSNQLVGYVLPSTTGFTTIQANLPATVENTGWEGEMSALILASKKIRWRTFLNFTLPKNKLLSFPNLDQSSYANTYKVGEPLNISLFYQYQGLDPETGYYTIADVNQDNRIDYEDRTQVQYWGKKFYGGLRNEVQLGDIYIQFLWEFAKQEGSLPLFHAGELGVQREDVVQALQPGSEYQRISASLQSRIAYSQIVETNFPIVDASYLKLRNFSVGCSIPSEILQVMKLDQGKIFLNGQNILTLTGYKGLDPELPRNGNQFAGLSTITAGLQLQF